MSNFGARNGASPFGQLLELVLPGASNRQELAFFDNRTQLRRLRDWKLGTRPAPSWAYAKLQDEITRQQAAIETVKARIPSAPKPRGNRATLRQYRQPS